MGAFLEKCLTKGHHELRGSDFRTAWCYFALALMRYREGNIDAASHWADRAMPIAGGHVARETMLHCLRAMIAWRKGDAWTAQALLDEASPSIEDYFSRPIQLGTSRGSWSDWLIARLLYQEARALIGNNPD